MHFFTQRFSVNKWGNDCRVTTLTQSARSPLTRSAITRSAIIAALLNLAIAVGVPKAGEAQMRYFKRARQGEVVPILIKSKGLAFSTTSAPWVVAIEAACMRFIKGVPLESGCVKVVRPEARGAVTYARVSDGIVPPIDAGVGKKVLAEATMKPVSGGNNAIGSGISVNNSIGNF